MGGMKHFISALFLALISLSFLTSVAQAQNTGGVFPPGFGDNHESVQYRIAYDTNTDNFANRIHYQKSIDANRLWRVLVQTRETNDSDFDFDFAQAELFWEFGDVKSKWRKGLRFDARYRDDDRAAQFGMNFNNQWALDDGWSARFITLTNIQIGNNRRSGVAISPRAQLAKKLDDGPTLGVEYFGSLGTTDNFSFGNSGQTVGPFLSTKLIGKTSIVTGVQFGVTDAAPDTELRFWITQGF